MSQLSQMDFRRLTPSLSPASRVCRLDFRPRRYFGCRAERALAEFFRCDEPTLLALPSAFRDLTQGVVRPSLDDRVLVEAGFAPASGRARATLTLYYRLPSEDGATIEKVLRSFQRLSSTSGYYRMSRGCELSLHGRTGVQTTVVEQRAGESHLITCVAIHIRALPSRRAQPASERPEFESPGADVPGE